MLLNSGYFIVCEYHVWLYSILTCKISCIQLESYTLNVFTIFFNVELYKFLRSYRKFNCKNERSETQI